MSITTDPATTGLDEPAPFADFRSLLAADLDNPAAYFERLTNLLSIYVGLLHRQHRRCDTPSCRTCLLFDDIIAVAQAHNSLQTFDEFHEIDRPYPLLSNITSARRPQPTSTQAGATA